MGLWLECAFTFTLYQKRFQNNKKTFWPSRSKMYGKKKNPIITNAFATPLALCHTGTLLYPRHHPRNAGQWDKAVCQSHLFQENNKCCVTIVMRHPGIPHNCLAILKLWVHHLQLFFMISVPVLYVPLQVKVKMNCSENMPMRTHSHLCGEAVNTTENSM